MPLRSHPDAHAQTHTPAHTPQLNEPKHHIESSPTPSLAHLMEQKRPASLVYSTTVTPRGMFQTARENERMLGDVPCTPLAQSFLWYTKRAPHKPTFLHVPRISPSLHTLTIVKLSRAAQEHSREHARDAQRETRPETRLLISRETVSVHIVRQSMHMSSPGLELPPPSSAPRNFLICAAAAF